jgi:hypothetical protein
MTNGCSMNKLLKISLLSLGLLAFSCVVEEKNLEDLELDADGGSDGNQTISGNTTSVNTVVETVQVKSFNQINMTMSKLTGVSRAEENIRNVVSQVLNQLPADNKLSGMTPFHQISITRLAFSYCNLFVNSDSEFSSLNYGNISDDAIKDRLINRFLDIAPANDPDRYEILSEEILSLLANTGTDSTGPLVDAGSGSNAEVKERLTKMSCTLILSSPFIILI